MAEHRRPVIVIPARFSAQASALRYRAGVTATALAESVYDAGGEPLTMHPVVPPGASSDQLDQLVSARIGIADGVLLPGGGDLAAHWSGQTPHGTEYDVDEEQDAFDLAVARVALTDGVPLLSICRGTQVVNVARGGTLIQDLTERLGKDHRHSEHVITIDPDSPLRGFVAADRLVISCYHHQSLDRPGAGLRAVAHAADGTVEAVVLDDHPGWYLGVQWHPEDNAATDPLQAGLFRAFVAASRVGAVLT